MLYKKNKSKALSDELFKSPTSEYRGAPFWAWNCRMTPEILEKQIGYFKEMGFGGFHMHSRSGMDNAYLGDEFMNLIRACTDKAKKENMLAWLYDEDRWPSGSAGGIVTKEPRYRARKVVFVPADKALLAEKYNNEIIDEKPLLDVSDELPMSEAVAEGKPYLVAAYDVILDADGYLSSYKKIRRNGRAKGTKWYAFCLTQPMSDWYNGYCYVDTLSPAAIKKFVAVTHERYKEIVGDEFDKTIPAIFSDEPRCTKKTVFERPCDKTACEIPWTPDFPKSYLKTYGSNILEHLPELFWDLSGGRVSITRYRYHDHACERLTNAFSKVCGEWCEKNKLKLTGHMMDEPSLCSQTSSVGEAMRSYKYFGYPGIDMLCDRVELTTAKQTQSIVRQYGKEAMISELYGVTNWDFDFRGHKFQGDWQAAMGVTVRVPHLSWVSMKGDAKRDFPASINYQSPWYKEYGYVEDHFARINTALTRGKPIVNVAVIHPIESYWLHWGPGATTAEKRNQLESNFQSLIQWLLLNQLDFDYISEAMLPDACKRVENPIRVGEMSYDVIIVPALETVRSTTVERLSEFLSLGGRVIFMGDCPSYVDCLENESIRKLYAKAEKVSFEKNAIVSALKKHRKVEIRGQDGGYKDNYIYQMRDEGAVKWLFVANVLKPHERKLKNRNVSKDDHPAERLYFKVNGKYTPKLYDTMEGTVKDISFEVENGFTLFSVDAYLYDSFLFGLYEYTVSSYDVPKDENTVTVKRYDRFGRVRYERTEPNVLLLDLGEWKWDNSTEYQPLEEMRRLDRQVRAKAGIPRKSGKQPWCLPQEKPEHTVTMRFTVNSEIDLCGAEFAAEDMDETEILLDGKKIEKRITGYFTDESIQKILLPEISKGEHFIEITKPLASRTYNENCFLLGDFNVRVEGFVCTLVAPTREIAFGSVVPQGLPFYGANIKYYIDVDVTEENLGLRIHSNLYRGSLISVALDGECVGKIAYNPYTLTVPDVTKGKHTVELTVFGNRHNSFGALHNCNREYKWFDPRAWNTKDDEFSYEYQLKEFGILSAPVIEVIKSKSDF